MPKANDVQFAAMFLYQANWYLDSAITALNCVDGGANFDAECEEVERSISGVRQYIRALAITHGFDHFIS